MNHEAVFAMVVILGQGLFLFVLWNAQRKRPQDNWRCPTCGRER